MCTVHIPYLPLIPLRIVREYESFQSTAQHVPTGDPLPVEPEHLLPTGCHRRAAGTISETLHNHIEVAKAGKNGTFLELNAEKTQA